MKSPWQKYETLRRRDLVAGAASPRALWGSFYGEPKHAATRNTWTRNSDTPIGGFRPIYVHR